ncbi:SURF1 family protein [Candidatus Endowatersipora endosymbiont of Watersipora subatra]|uniref:SURF1 family protein n=1 Tax=Candidatus Endowatersipora endosymbiont of Watersipora subatra TaxID=3077946 RepID=UPI00312CBA9E
MFRNICFLFLGISLLSSLGFWQLERLDWKETLIERVNMATREIPLTIDDINKSLKNGTDIEFKSIQAFGKFLHDREQHFFTTYKGKVGFDLYTPLEMNGGEILFVNRGFVPNSFKPISKRADSFLSGPISIQGFARSASRIKPNYFVPDNNIKKNIFYWKSLKQMSERAFPEGKVLVLPYFLDSGLEPISGGLPIPAVSTIVLNNRHLQYAITWFGLAIVLFYVGSFFISKNILTSRN